MGEIIKHPNDVKVAAPVQGIQGDTKPPDPRLSAQFKQDVELDARKAVQEEIQNVVKKDARMTVAQWMDITLELVRPYYPVGTQFAFAAYHTEKDDNVAILNTGTIEELEKAVQQVIAFKTAQQVASQQ